MQYTSRSKKSIAAWLRLAEAFLAVIVQILRVKSQDVCPEYCGSVRIPFPFGIGGGCGLPTFQLLCDQNSNGPSVQLSQDSPTYDVLDISFSSLIINATKLKASCCNCTAQSSLVIDSRAPYAVSGENVFVVNGCNASGSFTSDRTDGYTVQCQTGCQSSELGTDDYCDDIGCCISPVPSGSRVLHFTGGVISGADSPNECGFSNIFSPQISSSWNSSQFEVDRYGLQLDWAVQGAASCDDARLQPSYACSSTASCTYIDSVPGYICSCDQVGFMGDGYVNGSGCADVSECDGPRCSNEIGYQVRLAATPSPEPANGYGCGELSQNLCAANALCIDQGNGSYTCACDGTLTGDGLRNGTGCNNFPTHSNNEGETTSTEVYVCQNDDPRCRRKYKNATMIAAIAGSASIAFLLFACVGSRFLKHQPSKHQPRNFYLRNLTKLKILSEKFSSDGTEAAKIFTYKDLSVASNGFSSELELGSGGYGTVFKGTLANGTVVAIKKTNHVSEDGTEQFLNEVNILSQVNHRNLVKLLGCCLETEVPILVYEYIPNGTLFDHLHGLRQSVTGPLSCSQRLQIAIETAEALTYLHSAAFPPIYHRDVKSTNILLEEDLAVKVTDFGISRLVPKNATHVSTCVMGTPGYMDPEYYHNYQLTDRSDVYSFGVVLLELITSLKPVDFERKSLQVNLAALAIPHIKAGKLEEIADKQFLNSTDPNVMQTIHSLALLTLACLASPRDDRPTMQEVMEHLKKVKLIYCTTNSNSPPLKSQECDPYPFDSVSLSGNLDGFASILVDDLEGR